MRRSITLILTLALLLIGGIGAPGDARAQAETPILTVSGRLGGVVDGDSVTFSFEDLKALPQVEIAGENPWEAGSPSFSGPLLADVLALVGADGPVLEMVALNDYRIEIPAADAIDHGPILALERNGMAMRVRDKGPVWLIYPATAADTLGQETMEARMIWQLEEIVVR